MLERPTSAAKPYLTSPNNSKEFLLEHPVVDMPKKAMQALPQRDAVKGGGGGGQYEAREVTTDDLVKALRKSEERAHKAESEQIFLEDRMAFTEEQVLGLQEQIKELKAAHDNRVQELSSLLKVQQHERDYECQADCSECRSEERDQLAIVRMRTKSMQTCMEATAQRMTKLSNDHQQVLQSAEQYRRQVAESELAARQERQQRKRLERNLQQMTAMLTSGAEYGRILQTVVRGPTEADVEDILEKRRPGQVGSMSSSAYLDSGAEREGRNRGEPEEEAAADSAELMKQELRQLKTDLARKEEAWEAERNDLVTAKARLERRYDDLAGMEDEAQKRVRELSSRVEQLSTAQSSASEDKAALKKKFQAENTHLREQVATFMEAHSEALMEKEIEKERSNELQRQIDRLHQSRS